MVFEAMPSQSCTPSCRMEILKCMHRILKLKNTTSGGNSISVVLHAAYAYFNVLVFFFFKGSSNVLDPLSHIVEQPQCAQSEFLSDEIKP